MAKISMNLLWSSLSQPVVEAERSELLVGRHSVRPLDDEPVRGVLRIARFDGFAQLFVVRDGLFIAALIFQDLAGVSVGIAVPRKGLEKLLDSLEGAPGIPRQELLNSRPPQNCKPHSQ